MGISGSILGQLFIGFICLIGFLSYYLGTRKTQTPKLTAFLGVLLAFVPPFALLYIIVLIIKNDIQPVNNSR